MKLLVDFSTALVFGYCSFIITVTKLFYTPLFILVDTKQVFCLN